MHRTVTPALLLIATGMLFLPLLCACSGRGGVRPEATAEMPCPPWVEFPARANSNQDSIYLGCVNAMNLRSMLANPDDLLRGQEFGPASGTRESIGVERYNQGKVSAGKSAGSASPTIIMPAAGGGESQ